jgi:FAD binding domain
LQGILLEALADDVVVITNHQIVDVEHLEMGGDGMLDCVRADFIVNRQRVNPYVNWMSNDDQFGERDSVDTSSSSHADDANGMPRSSSMFARVIVGADGVNSRCRSIVYRCVGGAAGTEWERSSDAEYSGLCFIQSAGTPELSEYLTNALDDKYFEEGSVSTVVCCRKSVESILSPRVIVSKQASASTTCPLRFISLLVALPEGAVRESSRQSVVEKAVEAMSGSGFDQALVALGSKMWLSEDCKVIIRPMHVVPVDHPAPFDRLSTANPQPDYPESFYRPWGYGRIILAGDALHAMPPMLAQGTAQGFEDIAELIPFLEASQVWNVINPRPCGTNGDLHAIARVVSRYRAARIERVSTSQRFTMNRLSEHDIQAKQDLRYYLHNFSRSGSATE